MPIATVNRNWFVLGMEADFGDIEMQLTAYRGVVLEEHISKS